MGRVGGADRCGGDGGAAGRGAGGWWGVLLGGSRARGEHRPESDWDLGVYYRAPLDVEGLRKLAGPGVEVAGPGGWGAVGGRRGVAGGRRRGGGLDPARRRPGAARVGGLPGGPLRGGRPGGASAGVLVAVLRG
ncbi:nucleotidyltransferase domain-containing protein [Nonomuraea ferruginea]